MPSKNRILILSNGTAGLYRFRQELIYALCRDGEVTVLAKKSGNSAELEALGCRIIPTEIEYRGTNPVKELKLLSFYRKKLRELRPDVVLTYTIKPNIYGGMACAALGIPCVANITGLGDSIQNSGLLQKISMRLYRRGLRKDRMVFFQNAEDMEYMLAQKIVTGPSRLIPGSGVNLEKNCFEPYPDPDPEGRLVLNVIGRLIESKGIREILRAAERLRGQKLLLRFIGPANGELLDEVRRAEQDGLVKFEGYQTNVHEWMKRCHALLHASYHEGMSNVILEADACGRPVLCTDVPGCREGIRDGITGFSFPPRDAEAIARTVERFLALSQEERSRMGAESRALVEAQFDRELVVKEYMDVIAQALNEQNGK